MFLFLTQTVNIYLPEHKIKIEPKDGWFSKGVDVEVDDRKIRVSEGESSIVYNSDDDPRYTCAHYVLFSLEAVLYKDTFSPTDIFFIDNDNFLKKFSLSFRSGKACDVWREDEDRVVVSCQKVGVKVKSDGIDISVEVNT